MVNMKKTSIELPDDLLEILKRDVETEKFSSVSEAIRFYLRKGIE